METIDTVTLSVINNALINICREMGTAMMRTSYSPIFNEGLDFSCVIFNRRGDMIGQAEFCPTMLGSAQYAVNWTIEELGLESFEPGDVVVHNDPYRGQCHMPEHMVLKPVFFEGQIWGFVANIAHVGEIGGMAPGSFAADATEVYQEGLRLPPVKVISRGEYVKDVWKIILSNHRTPKVSRRAHLRHDDPVRARVQHRLDEGCTAAGHAHKRRPAARLRRQEMPAQRLRAHHAVLHVDPKKVDRIAQRVGRMRVGQRNRSANTDIARRHLGAEGCYR